MNVGLLDARGTGAIFSSLRSRFTPVEFFDLCNVIEEFVLREKVIIIGKYNLLPKDIKDALAPFIRAGIVEINFQPTQILRATAPSSGLVGFANEAFSSGLMTSSADDARYETTRLLGAEIDLKRPTTTLLRNLMHYGVSRRPVLDQGICDLRYNYNRLSERLEEQRWSYSKNNGIKYISVPPLALTCLKRAHSFDQLCDQILEVRDEYKHLRNMMIELAEILGNGSANYAKFVGLTSVWEQRWNKIVEPSSYMLGLGTSLPTLLSEGSKITSELANGNYRSLIKPLFDWVLPRIADREERLFRPLHTSVRNYLRASNDEMAQEVSRVFHISPKRAGMQMSAVACGNSNIWRAACAKLQHDQAA